MRYLISVYAWVVGSLYFLFLCFIAITLSFFLKPETFDPFIKKCLRGLFKIIFINVRSEGAGNIEPDKTYLFMSDHTNLLDIPLFEAYIPAFVRGVEALRQFKWPVYGWTIRRMGNIPIDRKNIHASIKSMKKTADILKKGKSIVILPEGHRTLDGKLRPFKKLPFYLAKQAEVPIIPIGLSGLFQIKRKGSWLIRPGTVKINFGRPIESKKIKAASIEELREYIRAHIQDLIE